MTDTKLPASHGTPFAPRALIPVAVGRTLVNLYAIIDPGMHVEERAHTFQINKTALASTPVDLRDQLNALGQQLNLAATVDGVQDDWLCFFHDSWCDFSRLAILSFHNDEGDLINDTMMHHPLHLHGHFFRVLDDRALADAPLKHTIDVPPMGKRTIEFEANESGDWLFHCHLLYHMHAGMMQVVTVRPQEEAA